MSRAKLLPAFAALILAANLSVQPATQAQQEQMSDNPLVLLRVGQAVEALHLSDIAFAADPSHQLALQAKLKALETLRSRCRNSNEQGDY